jgi:pimeloyl-ACP methyl ester carboxylesterase
VQSLHAAAIAANKVTAQAVTCPSLILCGVRDRILSVSTGHVLASKIPDARFVPLETWVTAWWWRPLASSVGSSSISLKTPDRPGAMPVGTRLGPAR